MKRIALALTLIVSSIILLVPVVIEPVSYSSTPSVPPAMEWAADYGGISGLSASQMIQTIDGGYAIAGNAIVHSYISSQPPYVWFVKADATGKMEWSQSYEHLYDVAGLVQTLDGGYIMSGNSYTAKGGNTYPEGIRIFKTDSNGSVQWSQTSKVFSGGASSMVQTNDGGYIIAGTSQNRGFLIKLDSSGKYIQWKKTYGDPNTYNSFSSVIQTTDIGYSLGGVMNPNSTSGENSNLHFWLVKTDEYGDVVWSQTFSAGPGDITDGHLLNSVTPGNNHAIPVVQTVDGGYVLAGNPIPPGATNSDAWLVKTDSHGSIVWNHTYGGAGIVPLQGTGQYVWNISGTESDYVYSLIQTSDGGLAFAGKTLTPVNSALIWFVKLDAAGNAEWNQTYPNRENGGEGWSANCLTETSDGGFAIAGTRDYTGSVKYYYLVKTEPALPPPTPTPPASSTPSNFIALTVITIVAVVAVVLISVGLLVHFRKHKHQPPATPSTNPPTLRLPNRPSTGFCILFLLGSKYAPNSVRNIQTRLLRTALFM